MNWLKGKKTYLVAAIAFLYGGGIQIGLWDHNTAIDAMLAAAGLATVRAGIQKAVVQAFAFGCLVLALSGCQSPKLESGGAYAPAAAVVSADGSTNLVATASPDPAFFVVDSSFDLAYSVIDAAFTFERENRAMLWKLSPEIKHSLDKIRPTAVEVRDRYITARAAYMSNPTPAGLSTLQDTLSKLKALSSAAQSAMPQ